MMRALLLALLLASCIGYARAQVNPANVTVVTPPINAGDTAWMLTSSALVMIMTPGLAFFYGGLVRANFIVNTLMMNYICLAIVTIQWVVFGYSFAFGPGTKGWGSFRWSGLHHVSNLKGYKAVSYNIPHQTHMLYQLFFAIITPALVSGAIVQRVKFFSFVLFVILWSTFVYDPLAHWVWAGWSNDNGDLRIGWLRDLEIMDFAGGTVVHISAGFAALAAAIVVGPRSKGAGTLAPHNIPFVLLGTALLWFGWFGFNGGSNFGADGVGTQAFVNTQIAASAAFLTWIVLDAVLFKGRSAAVGGATGAVVGLVAITPGSGFVRPWAAIPYGVILYGAIELKRKWEFLRERLDDTLDVFTCHGIGGLVGVLLTGFLATKEVNPFGYNGAFYGRPKQIWIQLVGAVVAMAYSTVATLVILLILKYTPFIGLRTRWQEEELGDVALHREAAYSVEMTSGEAGSAPHQSA